MTPTTLTRALALVALPLALSGCECDCETGDSDTETGIERLTIGVYGTATDVLTSDPAGNAHCIDAIDPAAALEGGELDIMGTDTIPGSGGFLVDDIDVEDNALALFMTVRDCDPGSEATIPTATGLPADAWADAEPGDLIEWDAFLVSAESAAGLHASLGALGETRTLDVGSMIVFVLDGDGEPIAGATLASDAFGAAGTVCYYVDGDPSDGLVTTAGAPNTATQPGVGMALCVGPAVGLITVEAEGYTFEQALFGSLPGLVSITAWTAQ